MIQGENKDTSKMHVHLLKNNRTWLDLIPMNAQKRDMP